VDYLAAMEPRSLFSPRDPAMSPRIMAALDVVNARFGRATGCVARRLVLLP
jgi:hypothetical protein